jgi:hypothetical protein
MTIMLEIKNKQFNISNLLLVTCTQIIRCFEFCKYIAFGLHLGVLSLYIVKTINLENPKRFIIGNEGIIKW